MAESSPPRADAEALLTALQHNWRKVASTDNLSLLAEETEVQPETFSRRRSIVTGVLLVLIGIGLLVWSLLAMLLSKLLPSGQATVLAAMKQDWYYCCLLPLMLPVTFITITASWFSLKVFKHNS